MEYVWVDALCIVQDDVAEIQDEIGNMAATYVNAWLQVAAMGSKGARHGLLVQGDDVKRGEEVGMEEHHLIMKACRSLVCSIHPPSLPFFPFFSHLT